MKDYRKFEIRNVELYLKGKKKSDNRFYRNKNISRVEISYTSPNYKDQSDKDKPPIF